MNRNIKRIVADYKEIVNDPIEHIHYVHDEENIMKGYALIIGPKDTPYENGFYFFDFTYPDNYPFSPPVVKFMTYDGFTRFNPNLYVNGFVCLSILNTWQGEKWSACQSIRTILLTLATILNDAPILNEPGITRGHPDFNNYHELIEYKNVEVSMVKYLEKTNLPYAFHCFYDIMTEHFVKSYPDIVKKFESKQNRTITLSLYSCSTSLNYKYLSTITKVVYLDLTRKIDTK
jgi:ubiquitin-conjugating enzyme E2 Z